MTYTFKLARRLAVSRAFSKLPILLILGACSGTEATGPQGSPAELPESGIYGWRPRESTPVQVKINPSSVTVETNQLIQFKARGQNRAGDNIVAPMSWSASGGTILPDGRFSAAAIGTYQVMGRSRIREDEFVVDTSTVTVVRRQIGLASVEVSPDTVTLTPRTSQKFSAVGRLRTGKVKPVGVVWTASGGTIDAGGNYLAGDTAGTYMVIAANTAGTLKDTATVTIAPPPSLPPPSDTTAPIEPAPPPPDTAPTLPPPDPAPTPPPTDTAPTPAPAPEPPPAPTVIKVTLTPATTTLAPGTTKQFTATATWSDSSTTAVTTWVPAGGTITPAGLYTAGTVAGTYRLIATSSGRADTSTITVTPTLVRVTLTPSTATLMPGTTKQFTATATWSDSSTTAVTTWVPAGGTITPAGLYTAGTVAGTYRLIATSSGRADTSSITVTQPLGSGSAMGIAYGAFGLVLAGVTPPSFSLSLDGYQPDNIISRIDAARTNRMHLVLAMTGGGHSNYMTNGVFDRAKWNAKMNLFNTAAIKSAVASAVADGTILGASVMDEPQADGDGADGNTWGPTGTMTKARVDSLCGYVKTIFPTLPAGVVHRHDVFEPTKSYRVCDFIASQYSTRAGSVTAFRDAGLAMAQRDGHAIMFSMNILNGGTQDKDGTWDCGGAPLGQDPPNCQMTATQLRDYGYTLGPAGCGLLMWRYDQSYMARTENKQAFADVAARLANTPSKQCRRP